MGGRSPFPIAVVRAVEENLGPDPTRVRECVAGLTGLPASFPLLQKALRLTESPACSFEEVEQVLSVEQNLTAQLLRIANSAFYAIPSEVTTISRAVAVLGQVKLRMLLLQMFVAGLFQSISQDDRLAENVWRDSEAAALACKAIAENLPYVEPDELLVGGLLHNIGEALFMAKFREEYEEAMNGRDGKEAYKAQIETFGVDSRRAGAWVLEVWNLPRLLVETAAYWDRPRLADVRGRGHEFLAVAHVGINMGRGWRRGLEFAEVKESMDHATLRRASISPAVLESIYRNLWDDSAQIKELREASAART